MNAGHPGRTGGRVRFDAHRLRRRLDLARPSDRNAVIALVIAAALALLIWSPSFGGRSPGDPTAVAADARFGRCGASVADAQYAFKIPHARDYQRYLPAMSRASELNLDPEALVVVFGSGHDFGGATSGPGDSAAAAGPDTIRDVCIYVGAAGQGELNFYTGVSIAGLRVVADGPAIVPPAQT